MTDEERRKRANISCRKWYAKNIEKERQRSREKHLRYKILRPERSRELARARYRKNPAKYATARNAYRTKYPIKAAATSTKYGRKWRAANLEKARQIDRKWRKNNPHKHAAKQSARKGAAKLATPKWANKFFIHEIYRFCRFKRKIMGIDFQVDHIVPLKSSLVCGLHVENNLQIVTALKNHSKGNRLWPGMPQ